MEIKGTASEKNLHSALVGESLARNKYSFYAATARKEGHTQVADEFERLAANEMMHAKFWFELLNGVKETKVNLLDAARGEFSEWHSMYPGFAAKAREEGLEELAVMFERVANIEKDHERQFMSLLTKLNAPANAPEPAAKKTHDGWRCQFCGAVFDAPQDVCDTCQAIGAFDHITWTE